MTDGYVRLSVGIEHIDDIIADIERGLNGGGETRKSRVAPVTPIVMPD